MKYMGSKRAMLQNGLGEILEAESTTCGRVVDLFCGSASVSWFAAQKLKKPVFSVDLQEYAVVLAGAVVCRDRALGASDLKLEWLEEVKLHRANYCVWTEALEVDEAGINTVTWRRWASDAVADQPDDAGPIWRSYAAHYYSPTQALTLDAMIECLPDNRASRLVCLAAAIVAASKCAASPGHTAQPFKAKGRAGIFLREAWLRDPLVYAGEFLDAVCGQHASVVGTTLAGDANEIAPTLKENDLVFVDPPYSGVHYSRFYHVLETIARGQCGPVEGVGRYPSRDERPSSSYSLKSESSDAMRELLKSLSAVGCKAVLTFPADECSNGLSGEDVEDIAAEYFRIDRKTVKTRFSTLGGNNKLRNARSLSDEMILLLKAG